MPLRSAPVVVTSAANPVALNCTAPPQGGPWATCAIELCEVAGPTRRRELLAVCTPIKVNCTYDSASTQTCLADLTGKVKQVQDYTVVATAIKADGRRSLTGPQANYNLPLYP